MISPTYFEKVVSKIAIADLDLQFEGAHVSQGGDVIAPGSDVISFDPDLADISPSAFAFRRSRT